MYVPPPAAGDGVCATCHGASGDYRECWSCRESRTGVDCPVELVVPISLVRTDQAGQLYAVLRDYKSSWLPTKVLTTHSLHVAALLLRFLDGHRPHIAAAAGRDYDAIAIVPSK